MQLNRRFAAPAGASHDHATDRRIGRRRRLICVDFPIGRVYGEEKEAETSDIWGLVCMGGSVGVAVGKGFVAGRGVMGACNL